MNLVQRAWHALVGAHHDRRWPRAGAPSGRTFDCFVLVAMLVCSAAVHGSEDDTRNAYFGDLHVHTRYSFDAYIFNVRADPDDAYRYARGEPLQHPFGYPMRLSGPPLDFMAVTDHATYMGVLSALGDPAHRLAGTEIARQLISSDPVEVRKAFLLATRAIISGMADPRLQHEDVIEDTWQREIAAAQRHNDPGRFTTFIGYEYSSNPPFNLHRNVIFRDTADGVARPFAATDSLNPEDLWNWMDANRARGVESLAIPHNSNWSNGLMFQRTSYEGAALDARYAEQRMRNEPIVEMTQVKGTSETHPLLSPNDEWADFEIFADTPPVYVSLVGKPDIDIHLDGSYVRGALLTGLKFEAANGFNPYQFGFIGSSDTHNAGASYDEDAFHSKTGINDGSPQRRGSVPPQGVADWASFAALPPNQKPAPWLIEWGASGLAGVWAEENSREAIYNALRRKETFATSGTRIRVRFFAGYQLDDLDLNAPGAVQRLYAAGVPMGGELLSRRRGAPRFFAWAARDPNSTWLQRLQIVKGWIDGGDSHERIYDVACSDGGTPDPDTHRCPDNGAGVDPSTCKFDIDKGATELSSSWLDPDFDPGQQAFYYVRVLENPTCRWSTWDALRAGIEPRPDVQVTIQERAWSSPIWVLPR